MNHVSGCVVALAFLTPLTGQNQASGQSVEQELRKADAEWFDAFFRGDGKSMDQMETDDLVLVFSRGDMFVKSRPRAGVQQPRESRDRGVEDVKVRLSGDVAVMTGSENGRFGRVRFTEIWVKKDGRWKVWSVQWTPIRIGDGESALNELQRASEQDPGDVRSYVRRGQVYLNQAQLQRAREDFEKAAKLAPKSTFVQNAIAWYWATHPNAEFRDGSRAVASATRACELTDWKVHMFLDTLAAAHAEAANFDEAVKWEEKALQLATTEPLRKEYEDRLALYRAGEPYREKAK